MSTAAALIPADAGLDRLRDIAAGCEACELHERGTQTVFGDGADAAEVVFVGEQPGDEEDLQGEPFVGPAGRELDRALEAVGIDRGAVWVTNVVKHFNWVQRGRRRLHEKPNAEHIAACFPWLEAELDRLRPQVVVALGATAAKALLGSGFRVTRQRGEIHRREFGRPGADGRDSYVVTATVHPSSILRAPSDEDRHAARAAFHDDLAAVATLIRSGPAAALRTDTKAALYGRARELDVPGRSTMDKDELASAVAERLTG